jgi:uncharacterized protein (DUF2249 family)
MATGTTIDVRSLAPRERHPRIFATFDSMAAGDAILLINDHYPKPLFYQPRRSGRAKFIGRRRSRGQSAG